MSWYGVVCGNGCRRNFVAIVCSVCIRNSRWYRLLRWLDDFFLQKNLLFLSPAARIGDEINFDIVCCDDIDIKIVCIIIMPRWLQTKVCTSFIVCVFKLQFARLVVKHQSTSILCWDYWMRLFRNMRPFASSAAMIGADFTVGVVLRRWLQMKFLWEDICNCDCRRSSRCYRLLWMAAVDIVCYNN